MPSALVTAQDVEELQNTIADIDWKETLQAVDEARKRDGILSLVVKQFGHVKLHMYRDEGVHKTPHFHIEFKREYRASYAIATLERIVGDMPRKYETPVLDWARQKQPQLMASWSALASGGEPMTIETKEREGW
jgi:hypothetical protein